MIVQRVVAAFVGVIVEDRAVVVSVTGADSKLAEATEVALAEETEEVSVEVIAVAFVEEIVGEASVDEAEALERRQVVEVALVIVVVEEADEEHQEAVVDVEVVV